MIGVGLLSRSLPGGAANVVFAGGGAVGVELIVCWRKTRFLREVIACCTGEMKEQTIAVAFPAVPVSLLVSVVYVAAVPCMNVWSQSWNSRNCG